MKTVSRVFWLVGMMTLGFSLLAGGASGEVKLVKGQTIYIPSPTSFVAGTHSFLSGLRCTSTTPTQRMQSI